VALDPPTVIRCINSAASTGCASTGRQSRHVACASSCISMRISLEEGIKLHRFAGIFPEQFSTEAGRQREAVVAADQRMVIRCFRDDLAHFVHDVSHVAILGDSRATALIWIMCGDPHFGGARQRQAARLPAVKQPPPRRALPIRRDDLAGPHASIAAGSSPSSPIAWCDIPGKPATSGC
jgi:hypothetical protein